ncbi:hypothetical protein M3Y98_01053900 [Aphelenchoides besseyi]|nr:hypothetical protein M3Y98_01053900 [Aphelenchoides besseyi]KAI6209771.1 hypothetical protein M3Y96_00256000 [Aphelenchoides besseyi]
MTGILQSLRSYPPSVYFILGNEFSERCCYHGLRTVLTLYLINEHGFSEPTAYLIYHAFLSLAFFSPVFGSILADNYFGRFKVIILGSSIYILGALCLSVGSIATLDFTVRSFLGFSGLLVIALATGGIKPCVSAFAADQFDENRENERSRFFSFFYFSINLGALCSMFLTPMLRGHLQCFGSDYCFPLAFGVPSILLLVAVAIFILGYKYYRIRDADKDNIITKVASCIGICLYRKLKAILEGQSKKSEILDWLDYAPSEYDRHHVNAVRSLIGVIVILLPLPFYSALSEQQGSTWIIQARALDGRIFDRIVILPDQMNLFNCLVVLISLFLFESFIFPTVGKICKITPLRRMATGGFIVGSSFLMCAFLQLEIQKTSIDQASPGNSLLFRIGSSDSRVWSEHGPYILQKGQNEWPTVFNELISDDGRRFGLILEEKKTYVVGVYLNEQNRTLVTSFPFENSKPPNGKTRFYLSVNPQSKLNGQSYRILDSNDNEVQKGEIGNGVQIDILPLTFGRPNYRFVYGDGFEIQIRASMGGVYVLELEDDYTLYLKSENKIRTLIKENTISILWQLPQILAISVGEVLICCTALEFAYSQAAPSMKSLLQAVWLMTIFFGNLINMFILGSKIFENPATQMFFYAGVMLTVMSIFAFLAVRYKYVDSKVFAKEEPNRTARVEWSLSPVKEELSTQSLDELANEKE